MSHGGFTPAHNGLHGIANQSGEGVEHLEVIVLGYECSL